MKSNDLQNVPSDDDILSVAIEWLLERQEGFQPHRQTEFNAWCDKDRRHAEAISEAEQTLDILAELPEIEAELLQPAEAAAAVEHEYVSPGRKSWSGSWLWLASAAAITLAVLVWRLPGTKPDTEHFDYAASPSLPQQIVLNDGSFVDLNVNTSIRSEMRPESRRIAMNEGEAHFAVAHDSSRPFIVAVQGIQVRAVGTAFNIKSTGDGVEVLVTEGRVLISQGGEGSKLAEALRMPTELGAAERAVFSESEGAVPSLIVERVTEQEVNRVIAWQKAVTTFANQPLREIVALFNRHGPLHIQIADPKMGDRRVGGSFALSQPEAFIRMLELEGDIVADRDAERGVVLRESH